MDILKGPAAPRSPRSRTTPAHTQLPTQQERAVAEQALARADLCTALLARVRGRANETAQEAQTTQLAVETAADDLIRCIAGPELDLTRVSYTHKLPPTVWSALHRYAQAGNTDGITTLTLGLGINFSDPDFLKGLAKLNVQSLRSNTLVSRQVARRVFKALPHLLTLQSRDMSSGSASVTISHSDLHSEGQKLRRRVRDAWAELDKEVNRTPGHMVSTRRAVNEVLAQMADVPMSAIEDGLQAMLLHVSRMGNEEVIRGITRAVLASENPLLEKSRKVSILTGGTPPARPAVLHASRLRKQALAATTRNARTPILQKTPSYRSALHGGKSEPEANRHAREGKVFIPALGAFVESPQEDIEEQDDLSGVALQPHLQVPPRPRAIRPPLLHQLVAEAAADRSLSVLAPSYFGIGALVAEIVPSSLDDPDIEAAIASVHLTAKGEMTWAQVAMENGHAGAVAEALVAILSAPVAIDLQHMLVGALRVDPDCVTAALKHPKLNRGPWAGRLVQRIEQRFPAQLSSPAHTKGTSVSQH